MNWNVHTQRKLLMSWLKDLFWHLPSTNWYWYWKEKNYLFSYYLQHEYLLPLINHSFEFCANFIVFSICKETLGSVLALLIGDWLATRVDNFFHALNQNTHLSQPFCAQVCLFLRILNWLLFLNVKFICRNSIYCFVMIAPKRLRIKTPMMRYIIAYITFLLKSQICGENVSNRK